MELVVFTGNRGVGKTLGMSLYAHYLKSETGCSLYSNFGLSDSVPFSKFDDFKNIALEKHSLLCLDEIHNDLDARDFASNSVKYFTHMIFYLRKLNCTIFMTTPLFENITSRVRAVVNVLVSVSKDHSFFYYDFYDVDRCIYLKRFRISKSKAYALAASIYDTRAIVTPLIYPDKRVDFDLLLNDIKEIALAH